MDIIPFPDGDPRDPDDAERRAAETRLYRGVLHELIELGADLARQVHRQATPETAAEATVAFDRAARAVRRTILLARSLDAPARAAGSAQRTLARKRVLRVVEERITRQADDAEEAESLHAELLERMDAPEMEDDIAHRPVSDVIQEICEDLGLGQEQWKRRLPGDAAELHARAAAAPGRMARGAGGEGDGPPGGGEGAGLPGGGEGAWPPGGGERGGPTVTPFRRR